jgi:hypothetical protein
VEVKDGLEARVELNMESVPGSCGFVSYGFDSKWSFYIALVYINHKNEAPFSVTVGKVSITRPQFLVDSICLVGYTRICPDSCTQQPSSCLWLAMASLITLVRNSK